MRNAAFTLEIFWHFFAELRNSTRRLDTARLGGIHAGRIIAAVFEREESVEQIPPGVFTLIARIGENTAHNRDYIILRLRRRLHELKMMSAISARKVLMAECIEAASGGRLG